jgi:hypothetical protein
MTYNILMTDLTEGLQSLLTLTCLEDIMLLAIETERVSLLNEADGRYVKPTRNKINPLEETLIHIQLNKDLLEIYRRANGKELTVEALSVMRDDFIFLQEFIHSAVPEIPKLKVRDIEVTKGLVYIEADDVYSKSYVFG